MFHSPYLAPVYFVRHATSRTPLTVGLDHLMRNFITARPTVHLACSIQQGDPLLPEIIKYPNSCHPSRHSAYHRRVPSRMLYVREGVAKVKCGVPQKARIYSSLGNFSFSSATFHSAALDAYASCRPMNGSKETAAHRYTGDRAEAFGASTGTRSSCTVSLFAERDATSI